MRRSPANLSLGAVPPPRMVSSAVGGVPSPRIVFSVVGAVPPPRSSRFVVGGVTSPRMPSPRILRPDGMPTSGSPTRTSRPSDATHWSLITGPWSFRSVVGAVPPPRSSRFDVGGVTSPRILSKDGMPTSGSPTKTRADLSDFTHWSLAIGHWSFACFP